MRGLVIALLLLALAAWTVLVFVQKMTDGMGG